MLLYFPFSYASSHLFCDLHLHFTYNILLFLSLMFFLYLHWCRFCLRDLLWFLKAAGVLFSFISYMFYFFAFSSKCLLCITGSVFSFLFRLFISCVFFSFSRPRGFCFRYFRMRCFLLHPPGGGGDGRCCLVEAAGGGGGWGSLTFTCRPTSGLAGALANLCPA